MIRRHLIYKHQPLRVTFDGEGVLDTIEVGAAGRLASGAGSLGRLILRHADDIRDFNLTAKAQKAGLAWAVDGLHPTIKD